MKQYLNFSFFLLILTSGCGASESLENPPQIGRNSLRIPELLDTRVTPEITLVMQNGAHEFYRGTPSDTKGFNGDYLGPTIRIYRDSEATITFANNLGEPTTVHGHGLHVNGEIDGGPQSRIPAGKSWRITIPVAQEAGTCWYHPHMMGKTAQHVHAGLAGMYIIEDENSQTLDLPRDYGVNDIPLIVQDRSFTDGRMNQYAVTRDEISDGLREDTIVVNGTVDALHSVPQGWVRLRLLNGSNARFYRFRFDNRAPFFKIATEGGFLNHPVEIQSIEMAPGERNEIMVDLSNGSNATLVADLLPEDPDDSDRRDWNTRQVNIVELRVDPTIRASGSLPARLNDIAFFDRADATRIRTISLEMEVRRDRVRRADRGRRIRRNATERETATTAGREKMFAINGRPMAMNHINERVNKGEVEIWRITGQRKPHPFHLHGASFQILTQNGARPATADRGWKDVVVVARENNEVTEIIVRFDHEATDRFPYMYHCHMLEHEDHGMMGQFTVE